jgi:ribokinase
MLDILSIGNATLDVILQSKAFKVHRDEHAAHGSTQTLTFGTKIDVEHMFTSVGGGAINSATTFARQGLRCGIVTQFGTDYAGKSILEHIKNEKIHFQNSIIEDTIQTALSTVLLTYSGERTVLAYRGNAKTKAAQRMQLKEEVAKWFYITSLGGDLLMLRALLEHAHENNIKVAVNPGKSELEQKAFKELLNGIDILIVNREEALSLVKHPRENTSLLASVSELRKGITVITNGARGAAATDGYTVYYIEPPKAEVVDRLGAGDAFGSGFVAGFVKHDSMTQALQLAASNAGSVCEQYGSTAGILYENQRLDHPKITEHSL